MLLLRVLFFSLLIGTSILVSKTIFNKLRDKNKNVTTYVNFLPFKELLKNIVIDEEDVLFVENLIDNNSIKILIRINDTDNLNTLIYANSLNYASVSFKIKIINENITDEDIFKVSLILKLITKTLNGYHLKFNHNSDRSAALKKIIDDLAFKLNNLPFERRKKYLYDNNLNCLDKTIIENEDIMQDKLLLDDNFFTSNKKPEFLTFKNKKNGL